MIDRGGRERERERERFRREYTPSRPEEKAPRRPPMPPSRHLWVGNLSHHLSESVLSEHFLRFGELDSIAFQPGRSYAFINYRREDDAMIAIRALQGFFVAGLPLRIEFAKADKFAAPSYDEHQQWRDERRSVERSERGASLIPRDSRLRHSSVEPLPHERSKIGDRNSEPSEVLWIGFPTSLNVDEMALREAFSPFGEIEKITVFPGRSYAFVRFRNMMTACRAKETLQGKLFNNPRVSICFAKSESGAPEHGRSLMNAPLSPHFRSNDHPGRSPDFRQDRRIGNSTVPSHMGSPRFASNLDSGDSGLTGFGRKSSPWIGGGGTFEPMRLPVPQSMRLPPDMYERHNSPARERAPLRRDFPPGRPPRKNSFFEDPPDLHDNNFLFRETKKLKTGPFPPDNELPEYPFTDPGPETGFSRPFLDFPENEVNHDNYGPGPFGHNLISGRMMNLARPYGGRDDRWKASNDRFEGDSASLPPNPTLPKALVPEPHEPPTSQEWKWEGTLAKGGSAICRARCFPVGKVMDSKLPEFLDCTARTGLDMLAKHYYQAANCWVVFFVPQSDTDIPLYNEFMHFLGERQRAAVAKLGEKTTLFLVPPSDFSEKVLKVPGKLSISGVILRFEHPSSDFGSLSHPLEAVDSKLPSFQEDISYPKPISSDIRSSAWVQNQGYSSSEPFLPLTSLPSSKKTGFEDIPLSGNMSGQASSGAYAGPTHLTERVPEPVSEPGYYQPQQNRNPTFQPNWTPHHLPNSNPGSGNSFPHMPNNAVHHSSVDINVARSRVMQETSSTHYTPVNSDILTSSTNYSHQEPKSQTASSVLPIPSVQPDQLAQLASLLAQGQQSGSGPASSLEGDRKQSNLANQPEPQMLQQASTSHYGQMHQLLQQASNVSTIPQPSSAEPQQQINDQLQNAGALEEDPQRRLQATLQLAATLLQQIQQQAKVVDQR